ncbi:MAG: hypothetical protein E2O61_08535 [Gammaproteobacteria bacterium]|nr:MAG: hypothetical protein E2O61_08535 [Gammaproteobacteria bacterium]
MIARTLLLFCWFGITSVFAQNSVTEATKTVDSDSEETASYVPEYPKTIQLPGGIVTIHPPQIRSWEDFEIIEGLAVVEAEVNDNPERRFGVLAFSADAVPDLDARTVAIDNVEITSITEQGRAVDEKLRLMIADAVTEGVREIPLDLVLSHLSDDVLERSMPGIKSQPPTIIVAKSPAIIVLLQGEPVLAPIGDAGLTFAANTNWPLFKVESSGQWYLRNNENWLVATGLEESWGWATELPDELSNLPDDDNWRSTRNAVTAWKGAPNTSPPTVFVHTKPAELILLDGEPKLVEIADTGLSYVENSESHLFSYNNRWYYLVSGRWFSNKSLDGGWQAVLQLPEVFASIPEDHLKADVLASVPNTPAAKIAALDAQIPKKTAVPLNTGLPETVTYAGAPKFEPIPDTSLSRAVNTSYEVIQVSGRYYLCYSGMWYVSNSAVGPWSVANSVPASIYQIPPSSPAYHTTYVKIYETSPVSVTFGYTSGYSSVYIVNGVPVYGTGWYYPPYYYYGGGYPIYYGYPYTYGSSSFYNPRTGAYGSVSRAYGPYGGWGYASGYNPRTGTYGRAEATWDYDEWYGVGEAYNPRTGRYVGTERYYDADDGDWKTNTTFEGTRGEVNVNRHFDDDSGRTNISTGAGGEATINRRKDDGVTNTTSEIRTADGRTISGSGRFEDGEGRTTLSGSEGGSGTIDRSVGPDGVTREGSFSKDGKTLTTQTNRNGSGPRTTFETSEGARGAVGGSGLNRTAVGESASGDLYAARNGNVWRKSDDGWYKHNDGSWSKAEVPDRFSQSGDRTRDRGSNSARSATGNRTDRANSTNRADRSSLNRDFGARQRGMNRSRNFNRGSRGGGRRR